MSNNEFKKIQSGKETRYVLETATGGATAAGSIASSPASLGKIIKRKMENTDHLDHEVEMARSDLYQLAKQALALQKMLSDVSERQGLEGWQQAKLTKAADYINAVFKSLNYKDDVTGELEGVMGGLAGGAIGAALTKTPSGAMTGYNIGSAAQDVLSGDNDEDLKELNSKTLANYIPAASKTLGDLSQPDQERRSKSITRAAAKLVQKPNGTDELDRNRSNKDGVAASEDLRDPKDNPCWKGYHPVGTKKKAGRTVPNCVPNNESTVENFADGKNPGRKGLAKRSGIDTKAGVSDLRKTAKHSSGEKQRMAHWLANMKAGRAKSENENIEEAPLDWQGTHSGTMQSATTDHTLDDAVEYLKSNYPAVKKYTVSRAEPGFRAVSGGGANSKMWHATQDPKYLNQKVLNKSEAHIKGVDAAVDYLQLKKNSLMSGSKQISNSLGYSWMTMENTSNGIAILYYQDRGMGRDEIYVAGKDKEKQAQAKEVFQDAGVLPTPAPRPQKKKEVKDSYTEELEKKLAEKIPPGASVDYYIKDFSKSTAPQFRGKSQAKRREMAIAAHYSAQQPKKTKRKK